MKSLELVIGPDPILETVCRPDFSIPEWLIPKMFRLLQQHKGLGLAAPQVGIDARLFITGWREVFINPEITWHSDCTTLAWESCLSFPSSTRCRTRYMNITVCGRRYDGIRALVIQHELDHLNGVTVTTKGVT